MSLLRHKPADMNYFAVSYITIMMLITNTINNHNNTCITCDNDSSALTLAHSPPTTHTHTQSGLPHEFNCTYIGCAVIRIERLMGILSFPPDKCFSPLLFRVRVAVDTVT